MNDNFSNTIFREFNFNGSRNGTNFIKSKQVEINGKCKISVDEESHGGVKVILKKDENENIKVIKFVCSCGDTKTVLLDYSE